MRRDGGNHHEKLGLEELLELRELLARVNLPSLIRQVRVLNWFVITAIRGLLNAIWQIVNMISHIGLYPP